MIFIRLACLAVVLLLLGTAIAAPVRTRKPQPRKVRPPAQVAAPNVPPTRTFRDFTNSKKANKAKASWRLAEDVARKTGEEWGKYPNNNPVGQKNAKELNDIADGHKKNMEDPKFGHQTFTDSLAAARASRKKAIQSNIAAVRHNLKIERAAMTAAMNANAGSFQ